MLFLCIITLPVKLQQTLSGPATCFRWRNYNLNIVTWSDWKSGVANCDDCLTITVQKATLPFNLTISGHINSLKNAASIGDLWECIHGSINNWCCMIMSFMCISMDLQVCQRSHAWFTWGKVTNEMCNQRNHITGKVMQRRSNINET